jgi:hypothetical protein
MYLGDGYIDKQPRTYRLRICLHCEQDKVIKDLVDSLSLIFPNNKIQKVKIKNAAALFVGVYSNRLPLLFPHIGSKEKHKRKIKLNYHQKKILSKIENAKSFIKGLIHSDGCRYIINDQVRYDFKNKSIDIVKLFIKYCNICGVRTASVRLSDNGCYIVSIYRNKDAAALEEFIGSKYLDIR